MKTTITYEKPGLIRHGNIRDITFRDSHWNCSVFGLGWDDDRCERDDD